MKTTNKRADLTELRKQAEQVNFKSLINCCCREFNNWGRYEGIPKYDAALAEYMQSTGYTSFLRFDFTSAGIEVFVPLAYFSDSGVHSFFFPVVERNCETDVINVIDPKRFLELIAGFAKNSYPDVDPEITQGRLENSISNLRGYLFDFQENDQTANQPELSFIEAEQSLILGHSVHPLPKSREGFTETELAQYSPETRGQFQLHYFLIHPEYVTEKSSEKELTTVQLKRELLIHGDDQIKDSLNQYPDWTVVPVHPWEADHLLNLAEVKEMQSEGFLHSLGKSGPLFTATSSVRTVYNAESEWMYKFSLHVKITNSFRVNYPHELHRGYDASVLLKTPWGEGIKKDYPEINFITDPAFIIVSYKGQVIDGFSTSIRQNPFRAAAAKKNVGLVASLTQDGILGQTPRMLNLIEEAARRKNKPKEEVAPDWFSQYLKITIKPLVGIFNKYGLGGEYHQQNMLVEFDEDLFPSRLHFRDNQGYFFRQGKVEELYTFIPDYGIDSRSFIAEPRLINFHSYYLLVNHLLGIVSALGSNKLADEQTLISLIYDAYQAEAETDTTGLVAHLLHSTKLTIKCNLLTNLNNMDEASAPRTHPAIYKEFPNPLNKKVFSRELIKPKGKDVVFSRYFPKEDVEITIRPLDPDRDLEMLHEWFHREHALKIWKMNWPIRELESFYRTLLAGDVVNSYIGEANGVPTFNFEVYWACRDLLGGYYDALITDYGTHQFIAPVDPKLKYASPSTQSILDYVFAEPKVGKMVGEGSVDSMASIMNKAHVGFKIEKVIELPDKKANLNFCYREWYWAKFPAAKDFRNELASALSTGKV
ncbi:siderophore synthetase component [Pedobacter cryoconitis]|uniref:Siderophore synthetase component n=1 Tax=Pedobacter cryoconitis TaxID=188932 RepID=A0A7W9E2E1_9SPHI|nr:GNAT family N-acetyltransferase [Pedobacter cryoconitis]MBB5638665.1 siderophore synthetase component [Pedobacter cryoconitis]